MSETITLDFPAPAGTQTTVPTFTAKPLAMLPAGDVSIASPGLVPIPSLENSGAPLDSAHETPAASAATSGSPHPAFSHPLPSDGRGTGLQILDSGWQPIADVPAYLKSRRPVAHYSAELPLWLRLPSEVAREVRALLDAFDLVNKYRKLKQSVSRACRAALKCFASWNWGLSRFRARYDAWVESRDWFVLVNRSRAGADFQERDGGLSEPFLAFVARRYGEFGRADGKRQAIHSIFAQWRTGKNPQGRPEAIPGYDQAWATRQSALLPAGWTYENILRQMKRRETFTRAVQAALHESTAAATAHLPQIHSTNAAMRFMEEVTFDDLRFDYLIFNPESGEAEELWALIARESSCRMVLGGVLHPGTLREDGTVTHLGAQQMKELAGQLLQTYPLPPYPVKWKVERGTATLAEAVKLALGELFDQRIKVSYTSMLGGKSPVGYAEKAKGNSRGKASHESHNRLYHTQGCFLPGQIGARYEIRPADLQARIKECQVIAADAKLLPAHLRGEVKFPMLTMAEARQYFRKFSVEQNFRADHDIEGFDEVLEWFDPADGQVKPRETIPSPLPFGAKIIQRRERPVERAMRLIRSVSGWTPCSPRVVIAFLEHTERIVDVEPSGEIKLTIDGKLHWFRNGGVPLAPGMKALVYFRPDEPDFIHLTDGKGAVLGTWFNRGRVAHNDRDALSEAMRYTHAAKQSALETAAQLAAPRREELEALRAHNAGLRQFIEVTSPPAAGQRPEDRGQISTATGTALTTVSEVVKADKQRARERTADLRRFSGDVEELAESRVPSSELEAEEEFSAEGLL